MLVLHTHTHTHFGVQLDVGIFLWKQGFNVYGFCLSGTGFPPVPLFGPLSRGKEGFQTDLRGKHEQELRFPHQRLTPLFTWPPVECGRAPVRQKRSGFWWERRKENALPVVGSHEVPGFLRAIL